MESTAVNITSAALKNDANPADVHWVHQWFLDCFHTLFKNKLIGWGLSLFYGILFVVGAGVCIYFGPVLQVYGAFYTCGMVFLVCGAMLSLYQAIVNAASSELDEVARKSEQVLDAAQHNLTKMEDTLKDTQQEVKALSSQNLKYQAHNIKLEKQTAFFEKNNISMQKSLKAQQAALKSYQEMNAMFMANLGDSEAIKNKLKEHTTKQGENIKKMQTLIEEMHLLVGEKAKFEHLEKIEEIAKESDDKRNPLIEPITTLLNQLKTNNYSLLPQDKKLVMDVLTGVLEDNDRYDRESLSLL
ncbi:MAG TPA: hypothetical protein QF353_03595 [Gammaproteobacteria bacterium]|nr:hypothetical protein [Gammaproteobacteria bacterium]